MAGATSTLTGWNLRSPDIGELKSMAALVKAMPEIDESREGQLAREIGDRTGASVAGGDALMALRALLADVDPKGDKHRLQRIFMENNDIYWVCEGHYQQFKRRQPRFTPLGPSDPAES